MPSDTSPELPLRVETPSRFAAWLTGLTIALLAACLLLISPDTTGERQRPWPTHGTAAWLLQVVRLEALYYAFPTQNGVEIKQIAFQFGACLLSLVGGIALLLRARFPSTANDGWRAALRSPVPWFILVLLVSIISASRSSAPRVAAGGTVIRLFWLLWWWPLAVLLTPHAARRVIVGLVAAAAVTAAIGLWYQHDRAPPDTRLGYPMGSPLFVAACLLPALMIAGVLAVALLRRAAMTSHSEPEAPATDSTPAHSPRARHTSRPRLALSGVALALAAAVLALAARATDSRSAYLGFGFGLLITAYLAGERLVRAWLLATLAISCGLIAGKLLVTGDIGNTVIATAYQLTGRNASIRARIEHEWPFAFAIFLKHPWLGSGEGGFGRGVGPYVRSAQLDDPTLLSADASVWENYAHNELLEMLTSVGVLGAAAMVIALLLTLRAARRAAEAATDGHERAWLIAMTAAFVAAATEELTDVALHKPGFAPLALTVWACLWVMVRSAGKRPRGDAVREDADQGARSGLAIVCRTAAAVLVIVVSLGAFGLACADAAAHRAYYESNRLCAAGQFEAAVPLADRTLAWQLDPARALNALVLSAQSRVWAAQQLASAPDVAQRAQADALCHATLDRTDDLLKTADRYLRGRELEAAAATLLSATARQRGDLPAAAKFAERARRAWRFNRDDEPFSMQALIRLWDADPTARTDERLRWLRDIMRGGEVTPQWDERLLSLGDSLRPPLTNLLSVAAADLRVAAGAWRDPLSPETFRLAARAAQLFGNPDRTLAIRLVANAATLYGRAGGRLARAHGAALHEKADYVFDADPNHAHEALDLLKQGYESVTGLRTDGPLAGNMGRTRLPMLLYLGLLEDARAQTTLLASAGGGTTAQILAAGYLNLVSRFGERGDDEAARRLLDWSQHAVELDSASADARRFVAAVALRLGRDSLAAEAIEEYRRTETQARVVDVELARLMKRFPDSAVWKSAASRPAAASGSTDH